MNLFEIHLELSIGLRSENIEINIKTKISNVVSYPSPSTSLRTRPSFSSWIFIFGTSSSNSISFSFCSPSPLVCFCFLVAAFTFLKCFNTKPNFSSWKCYQLFPPHSSSWFRFQAVLKTFVNLCTRSSWMFLVSDISAVSLHLILKEF